MFHFRITAEHIPFLINKIHLIGTCRTRAWIYNTICMKVKYIITFSDWILSMYILKNLNICWTSFCMASINNFSLSFGATASFVSLFLWWGMVAVKKKKKKACGWSCPVTDETFLASNSPVQAREGGSVKNIPHPWSNERKNQRIGTICFSIRVLLVKNQPRS